MTDARVVGRGRDGQVSLVGCGFALTGAEIITGAHVVGQRDPGELAVVLPYGPADERTYEVTAVDRDDDLDAAVLHLDCPHGTTVRAAVAAVGLPWSVTARPKPADPQLTGVVATPARTILTERGESLTVIQLTVDQQLRDFHGYSGSAVRAGGAIIGVLSEQVNERIRPAVAGRRPAANVLYAVPLAPILSRFSLSAPAADSGYARVAELLADGEVAAADRELDRLRPAYGTRADFWAWRAQVALANDNPEVACALADRGLAIDAGLPLAIAVKVRALLLRGRSGDGDAARALGEPARGLNPELDAWLACLESAGSFGPGIRTKTELDAACPLPTFMEDVP